MDVKTDPAVCMEIDNDIIWDECDESELEAVMETSCVTNLVKDSVESLDGVVFDKLENSHSENDLDIDLCEFSSWDASASGSETYCKLSGDNKESAYSDDVMPATENMRNLPALEQLEEQGTRDASDHPVNTTEDDTKEETFVSTFDVMITENPQDLLTLEELMKIVLEDSLEKEHLSQIDSKGSSWDQDILASQGTRTQLDVLLTRNNRTEIEDMSEAGDMVKTMDSYVSPGELSKDCHTSQNDDYDKIYSQVTEADKVETDNILEDIEAPPKWIPVEDEFEVKNKLVFAKVKGFPYWPAYLEETSDQKGLVIFNNGSIGTAMNTLSFDNTSKLWILKNASFSYKRGHTRKDFIKVCSLMEQKV